MKCKILKLKRRGILRLLHFNIFESKKNRLTCYTISLPYWFTSKYTGFSCLFMQYHISSLLKVKRDERFSFVWIQLLNMKLLLVSGSEINLETLEISINNISQNVKHVWSAWNIYYLETVVHKKKCSVMGWKLEAVWKKSFVARFLCWNWVKPEVLEFRLNIRLPILEKKKKP